MGTNYYCDNSYGDPPTGEALEPTRLHIGKSSGGWCFMLHVIPERGLNSLEDWKKLWNEDIWEIYDEYGNPVSNMEDIITTRWGYEGRVLRPEFHAANYSEGGPHGLVRFRLDAPGCVGHGEGTWDLIEGEFS